ncbi:reverse transcriptase family protein [Thiomicrorhabdus sp.]|uniref:reverse transcriptase family protein n=1 Tax=Thiomicrorhabdus sp. TaxID=2039724 RepID=UPI002AA5FCA9|nr:reverse transcriptase family protein [Thiomicrorhabdus sp.]
MTQKKKPLSKIQSKGKSYSITQSPFYKVSSKKRLANILGCSPKALKKLSSDSFYNVFNVNNDKGNVREIQQPISELEAIHTRIASLMSRIAIPIDIHSGLKKRSHVTNAKQHIGNKKLLTTDIRKFFPSTSKEMVFRLFFYDFKMPGDIARLMSDVCCFKNGLPTGSRLSMHMAYWANHGMFEEIDNLCKSLNLVFTVYVDDLTISGDSVNELLLNTLKKIVGRYNHRLHEEKTRIYGKNEKKLVTGVIIDGNQTKVKNQQLKNIFEDMEQWKLVKGTPLELPSIKQRLVGRLSAASQVQSSFKDKARSVLKD